MPVVVSTKMVKQFKMYLDEAQIAALDRAAASYKRRSGQQVAEEIIATYLPFWEQGEIVKQNRTIPAQFEVLFGTKFDPEQSLKPLATQGVKETSDTDTVEAEIAPTRKATRRNRRKA